MPVSFTLNDGIGIFTTVGDVDFEEGLDILEKGMDEVRKSGQPHVLLFDLSQSAENRSVEELHMISVFIQERLPHAHLAMVAQQDLYYGISRMFSSFAESLSLESRAFRNRDDAIDWCNARARVKPQDTKESTEITAQSEQPSNLETTETS